MNDFEKRRDEIIKKRIQKKIALENYAGDMQKSGKDRADQVIIDGIFYESLTVASQKTGMSRQTIQRCLKKLEKSALSEQVFTVSVRRNATFKKVKQRE